MDNDNTLELDTVGKRLKYIRILNGYSMDQAAKQVQVSPYAYLFNKAKKELEKEGRLTKTTKDSIVTVFKRDKEYENNEFNPRILENANDAMELINRKYNDKRSISSATISNIENEFASVNSDIIVELANLFNVSLDWLLKGSDGSELNSVISNDAYSNFSEEQKKIFNAFVQFIKEYE